MRLIVGYWPAAGPGTAHARGNSRAAARPRLRFASWPASASLTGAGRSAAAAAGSAWGGIVTTSGGTRAGQTRPARRALAMTLLLGAAGAGIAFLATRQGWARVRTTPPAPLPPSVVSVTGSALVPYADALAVAGLASLAAVLATRQLWRRLS